MKKLKKQLSDNPLLVTIGVSITAICLGGVPLGLWTMKDISQFLTEVFIIFFLRTQPNGGTGEGGGASGEEAVVSRRSSGEGAGVVALLIVVGTMSMTLVSCGSHRRTTSEVHSERTSETARVQDLVQRSQDSTSIGLMPALVLADTVTAAPDYDSLRPALLRLQAQGLPARIVYRNAIGRMDLTFRLDSLNHVVVECSTREQQLSLLLKNYRTRYERMARDSLSRVAALREAKSTTNLKTPYGYWLAALVFACAAAVLLLLFFTLRQRRRA